MFKFLFSADGSQFTRGLKKMKGEVKGFASSSAKMMAGAFLGGGALAGLNKLSTELDRIGKLSTRFNEAPEAIQRMSHAAELAGSDMERLAKGLSNVNRVAEEAISGNARAEEAFANMGIAAEEFKSLSMEDQLKALADGYANAEESGTAFETMNIALGGSYRELLPLLQSGREGIEEVGETTKTVSEETIRKVEAMNDKWTTFKTNTLASVAEFGATLFKMFPVVKAFGAIIKESIVGVVEQSVTALGGLGKVLEKLFSGDVRGAMGAVRETGNQMMTRAADRGGNMRDITSNMFEEMRDAEIDSRITQRKRKADRDDKRKTASDNIIKKKKDEAEIAKNENINESLGRTASALEDILKAGESDLDSLMNSKAASGIIQSTLGAVGGGGNNVVSFDPALAEQRRQTAIQEQIQKNTSIKKDLEQVQTAGQYDQ